MDNGPLLCEPRRIYKKLTIECISQQEKFNTTRTIIIYKEKKARVMKNCQQSI